MTARDRDRLLLTCRILLGLLGASLALAAVLAYLLVRRPEGLLPAAALSDPEVRRQAIARLVAENPKIHDSHVDADVGRVYLPNLTDLEMANLHGDGTILVSTNRFGMRERDYALPKPAGVVRVVLLGDSMVFGLGVAAEDRLGAHLETWLAERTPGFEGTIECLHLGVASWNIRSESAYLRRQLSDLEADLVVHLVVPNDIADTVGARGFGAPASFSPQRRDRADSLLSAGHPLTLGFSKSGFLRLGIDYESRARYEAAALELRRLARAVEEAGGEYRLVVHYRHLLAVAGQRLARHLEPEKVVYLSRRFALDQSYYIAPKDPHWNREGHARVAKLIYGLITRDALLPRLDPPPWTEASEVLEEIGDAGRREALRDLDEQQVLALYRSPPVVASIDFRALETWTAAQVHGGVDAHGRVSPYASLLLRNDGGVRLVIDGRTFPRPEIDGARVRVFVDAKQVGEIEIRADTELALSYPLPAAASDRPYLSVRFEADDYVYQEPDLQHCAVFTLRRVAIEP